jgi:hypothetical protein
MDAQMINSLFYVVTFFMGMFCGWQFCLKNIQRKKAKEVAREREARRITQLRTTQNNYGGMLKNLLKERLQGVTAEITPHSFSNEPYKLHVAIRGELAFAIVLDILAPKGSAQINIYARGKWKDRVYDGHLLTIDDLTIHHSAELVSAKVYRQSN